MCEIYGVLCGCAFWCGDGVLEVASVEDIVLEICVNLLLEGISGLEYGFWKWR
jgi:hypothetical protein